MEDYRDFTEDERSFYLHEAGFDSRESMLFRLRVYDEKTLWEAAEIMGYSSRTIDRINRKNEKEDYSMRPDVLSGRFFAMEIK